MRRNFIFSVSVLSLTGCMGVVSDVPATPGPGPMTELPYDGGMPEPPEVACDGVVDVGATSISHLTRTEYINAIFDLTGQRVEVGAVAADNRTDGARSIISTGYDVGAQISPILAEQYIDIASTVVARALPTLKAGCAAQDATCATTLIDTFARRAYRRPIASDQRAELMELYETGVAEGGHDVGLELMIQGVLIAPDFLYHAEARGGSAGQIAELDAFDVASRLSFFLWRSIPDDALLDAAANGRLANAAGIEAEARRLLADARVERTFRDFYEQWANLSSLASAERDATLFPGFSPDVASSLTDSFARVASEVSSDGSFEDLMTVSYGYVDSRTASIFGVESNSSSLVRMELDPTQRRGLLTHPAVLAAFGKKDQTDPIHRGIFVQQRVLCNNIPSPPAGFSPQFPLLSAGRTARERFAAQLTDAQCSGCHASIDTVGYGFENYSAVGAYRTTENGIAIDASGSVDSADFTPEFNGAPQLALGLSTSAVAESCFTRQWLRYSLKRTETNADTCSISSAYDALQGGTIADMLARIATSEAFLHRRIPAES